MENEDKSYDVRLAVMEADIKYIKEKIDDLNFKESFEKQGERIGKVEQDLAILQSKVKALLWGVSIMGSTAIASITVAIIRLVGGQ